MSRMSNDVLNCASILAGRKIRQRNLKYCPIMKIWQITVIVTPDTARKVIAAGFLTANRKRTSTALNSLREAIQNKYVSIFDPIMIRDTDGQIVNGGHRLTLIAEVVQKNAKFPFFLWVNVNNDQLAATDSGKKRNWKDQLRMIYGDRPSTATSLIVGALDYIRDGKLDCQRSTGIFDFFAYQEFLESNTLVHDAAEFLNTWQGYIKGKRRALEGIIDTFFKIWITEGPTEGANVIKQFFSHLSNSTEQNAYADIYDYFYGRENGYMAYVAIKGEGTKVHVGSETSKRKRLIDMLIDIDGKYTYLLNPYV